MLPYLSRRMLIGLALFSSPVSLHAQARLRNLSHETVGGRALILGDGTAEFHRNGQYHWKPKSGAGSKGQWQLISDIGPHPQVILVTFANGKQARFRIRDEGGTFYLMRDNNRRFRILDITPL